MILQALVEYYDRKAATGSAEVAPPGFEWKTIPFILVLNPDGSLLQIEDTRSHEGNKLVARRFLVAQDVGRTIAVDPNLMWDKAEYALGIDVKGNPKRTRLQFEAFRQRIVTELAGVTHDEGIQAVLRFLENPNLKDARPDLVEHIININPNISFRLAGEAHLISERPNVVDAIQTSGDTQLASMGVCLVSGENEKIKRTHHKIKGISPPQPGGGGSLVSFDDKAFTSYGKEQGDNAPVGASAVFKYTTALNLLLDKKSNQRMQVGDASTVFWSKQGSKLEEDFSSLFSEPPDNPDARTTAIRDLFASIHNGAYVADDSSDIFYVLGLSPNASRIAIRFWYVGTVAETGLRIAQWFKDLETVGIEKYGYPSISGILKAIALKGESKNIPPNVAGDTMRAILAGVPLPETLLQAAIRRNRAERNVTYPRASLIRAALNRKLRFYRSTNPHFSMALDTEHPNTGYQLGRLFAVIEKTQKDANMGDNLKSFYGSASSTPQAVFATLIARHRYHVDKLDSQGRTGQAVNRRKLVAEIVSHFGGVLPARLSLADQGAFAIGYYHQQQAFFTAKEEKEEKSNNTLF